MANSSDITSVNGFNGVSGGTSVQPIISSGNTQSQIGIKIRVAPEQTWGVIPNSGYRDYARVSLQLDFKADALVSNRIRSDGQIADSRLGTGSTSGSMDDEFSTIVTRTFIESALNSTFSTISAKTVSGSISSGTKPYEYVLTASGLISNLSLFPGQIIDISGLVAQVLSVSEESATLLIETGTVTSGTNTFNIQPYGVVIYNGMSPSSFTIEQELSDLSPVQYISYTGVRVGGVTWASDPSKLSTVTYTLNGQARTLPYTQSNASSSESEYDTSSFDAQSTSVFINGVRALNLSTLSIAHTKNTQTRALVGSKNIGSITDGRHDITGSFDILVQDLSVVAALQNEDDISLVFVSYDKTYESYSVISLPRCRLSQANLDLSGEDEATISANFQALRDENLGFTIAYQEYAYGYDTAPTPTSAISVSSVSVSPATLSVKVGDTSNLTASVSPSDASNTSVSFSSSNSEVATVTSSGVVTGVAAGTATVTVKSDDGGYTATADITVTAAS